MIRADDKIVAPSYIDFIHTKPCCACPKSEAIHAHHVRARGRGSAFQNDFTAVPLCFTCHRFFHDHGQEEFEAAKWINLYQVALLLVVEFFLTHERPKIMVGKRLQGIIS